MDENKVQQDKSDVQANLNKIKVLQLIRNGKEITRAEILQKSGLSAPTVTRMVESLTQMSLVQSDGMGSSIGGRPPQLIKFNSKGNYVIGIDLGATFIRAVLSNLDGEFVFEIHVPTHLKKGFQEVMDQVGSLIEKLSQRAQQKELKLWGIGIAVCGMVNKNTGIVEYSPIFDWRNVDIKAALSKYTSLKIALGNVVNLIAMGELLYGVGQMYSNFICVNLGYGIGAGVIIDGKLFAGADGIAGEIGHIVIDRHSSRKGSEGIAGTLEALASGYGIADIAQELSALAPQSSLHSIPDEDLDAKRLFEEAQSGDALAREIVDGVAGDISLGIDILIKLFNTECIVLSGGLLQNGDLLLGKIKEELKKYSIGAVSRTVPILQASFGENAALMGSFSLILEKILLLEQEVF